MTDDLAVTTGLRARKRAKTRSVIEHAAVELALERGYENVTVEMICAASDISQRTFFNYFGSKEGVILGQPPSMDDLDVHRFVTERGQDIVHDLVRIMASAVMDETVDSAFLRSRFLVISKTPELLGRQMEWMVAQENELVDVVRARFAAEGRVGDDLDDEAEMVVALAFTVLRYTLQKLFVSPAGESAENTLATASALIRRITSR